MPEVLMGAQGSPDIGTFYFFTVSLKKLAGRTIFERQTIMGEQISCKGNNKNNIKQRLVSIFVLGLFLVYYLIFSA